MKKLKMQFNSKITVLSSIKSFIRFCNFEKQLLHLNSDKIFLPKMEFKEARYLKESEIINILQEVKKKDLRLSVAIMLLATT
jgi:site-specific recombinase XerD